MRSGAPERATAVVIAALVAFLLPAMPVVASEQVKLPESQASAADPPATPADPATKPSEPPAVFRPAERAVSTWRTEAKESLNLRESQTAALQNTGASPRVARCVKLNNYWCIKKAGWNGEIAADAEGHVAFASAVEGAAVAALLLRRYYVDFHRRSALAIISRWAPAHCGGPLVAGPARPFHSIKSLAPQGIAGTLRARWLAGHSRGFVIVRPGGTASVRRTTIADRVSRPMPAPTIAVGLGEGNRPIKPITLDALLQTSPNAPPSRSMNGQPRVRRPSVLAGRDSLTDDALGGGGLSVCTADGNRIAAYASAAAAGIRPAPDGDLALFSSDGRPTANLATLMANMARVEIGPLGPKPGLISAGIAEAFRPGRNPGKS